MTWLLTAIGIILVFEGLVFALAPARLESLLRALAGLSLENRRLLGLTALACGVAMLWLLHLSGNL